jgi:site-specific recombinase XerC
VNRQTQRSALGPERLAGQLDVEQVLELVVRDEASAASGALRGELVAPAAELADDFAATLVARPQTQRTYLRACRRFVAWLGPQAGPEHLSARNVAAYHAHLVAAGRASATVKKDRAALNSWLRWLVEHDRIPAAQAREALAVRLPRAEQTEREPPMALSAAQYERLLREAKARIADDPLAGSRDLALVLVLGDAGLRCEELARLERRDFLPARKGAHLRALDVRHGKGDRQRRVKLSTAAARAIVRWDRERTRELGPPADDAPMFVTLGSRRRDGSYTRAGGRCRPSCAIRTRCATPAPPSCCAPAPRSPTCASFWATPRSRPPRCTWPLATSAKRMLFGSANEAARRWTSIATRSKRRAGGRRPGGDGVRAAHVVPLARHPWGGGGRP